ncbi:IS3 family transposase [Candidatus Paracaedibacter symbiosus]|uniref:IS3 family transposase n=1 Tax=Candidatus Paracaedibacter symbiosus TaxID=244582 RepID=UPI00068AECFF|nr:IS3 family transposase [Candidatus Paracaedibacter symbiosus]
MGALPLFSRQVVGLSMGQRQTKDLVINALRQAILHRGILQALVHHSDRGSQYASHEFQALLQDYGITPSMSGTGNFMTTLS